MLLWPPDVKNWLIGKDPDAGKDWGQEEKQMTEDQMAGWHHRLDGCEFEWTLGVGEGQGGLACCDSWGHRVRLDWVTELNWTEVIPEWSNVFPTFFSFSLNLVIRSSWSEPQSALSLVFRWLYKASPSLTAKNIMNLILVLAIWWCPCVESSLVLLEEGVYYDQCVLLAELY